MSDSMLQEALDRVTVTSRQRWALIASAALSCTAASMIAALAAGDRVGMSTVVIFALGLAAATRPDSHLAVFPMLVIVWQWLAGADDQLTPWSIGVAVCLVVFHCTVATMAVTPLSAVVDLGIIIVRAAAVSAAAVAMWCIVAVLGDGTSPGSVPLAVAGFVALTVLTIVGRQLSRPAGIEPDVSPWYE